MGFSKKSLYLKWFDFGIFPNKLHLVETNTPALAWGILPIAILGMYQHLPLEKLC